MLTLSFSLPVVSSMTLCCMLRVKSQKTHKTGANMKIAIKTNGDIEIEFLRLSRQWRKGFYFVRLLESWNLQMQSSSFRLETDFLLSGSMRGSLVVEDKRPCLWSIRANVWLLKFSHFIRDTLFKMAQRWNHHEFFVIRLCSSSSAGCAYTLKVFRVCSAWNFSEFRLELTSAVIARPMSSMKC